MGDPRKNRKKYTSPGHPYQKARIEKNASLQIKVQSQTRTY